ncbi:hypothetical protein IMCC26134_05025 [Verrucomicrobia bacterium IMCC26134]|nr:hypothetical protein IMCC26134_05025 [Verrucomicrobia bacterium IMCC26134]
MNSGTGTVNLGASGSGSQGIEITAGQNWNNNSTSLLTVNRVSVDDLASSGTYTLTINGSGSGGTTFPQSMGDVNNTSNATIILALAINTTGGNTTLAGANVYSGGTTLTAGTLQLGVNSAGAVGAVTSSAIGTGTLALNGGQISSNTAGNNRSILNAITIGGNVILGDASNNGTLTFSAGADIGSSTRTFTTASAATFSGNINGTGGITKAGAAALTLSGNSTYSGGTTLSAGTLILGLDTFGAVGAVTNGSVGNGTLTLNGGTISSGSSRTILNALTIGGDVTFGDATNTSQMTFSAPADLNGGNRTLTTATGVTTILNGIVTNGGIIKNGAGALKLGAVSTTYVGGFILNAGTIQIAASSVFGTGTLTLNAGTIASSTATSKIITNAVTFGGDVILGSVGTSTGNMTFSGATDLGGATRTLTTGSGFVQFSNVLSNGGINKDGTSPLILSGNNTYTGATTITAGTLQVGAGGTSGSIATTSGVTNNAALVYNRSNDITAGYAIGGNGTLTKLGNGTLTLSVANTYTGNTTVSAGTFGLTGNSTSPVALADGTVLQLALASPVTSTSTLTFAGNATVSIVGTPVAATTYNLFTGSAITGTPALSAPISGFTLSNNGTVLQLVPSGGGGDTTNPIITLNGNATLTVNMGTTYTDAGATATDETAPANPTVTTSGTVNTAAPGIYVLSYNAVDAAGNNALTVTRTVTVVDATAPVITRTGAATVSIDWGSPYSDAGATATDNYDPSVTVTTSGTVNTAKPGTYTLTYNASDVALNAATPVTRTVTVAIANSTTVDANGYTPLMRYALGANGPGDIVAAPVTSATATELSLTAVVRTDDPKLSVLGTTRTDLTSGTWATTGVSGSPAGSGTEGDQTGVITGQRRVYTVTTTTKTFLRLEATLTP